MPPTKTPHTGDSRPDRKPASARRRILGWYMVTLAVALLTGLLIMRTALISQVNRQVDAEMILEVEEVRALSTGVDPESGEPFAGNVAAIFDTFLARNFPNPGEALFTLIDGRPYKSSVTPVQLLDDAPLVAEWAAIGTTGWGEEHTERGLVRWLATPLRDDERVAGTFIVAMFMDDRLSGVDRALRTGALVFGAAFLAATLVTWFAAGRVLRPIRLLTDAARSVDDENWADRIAVTGDEEVAELARTFNAMLDRLESSFATQRRFIDDAGHELRTPITIIRGHLELLDRAPAEATEAKAVIDDELDHMARIVDDLLLLARADHGEFLEPAPVDVADLIADITSKVRGLADRPWTVDNQATVVAMMDAQRITQAMINLARNAIEHTPDGTAIEIGSAADADGLRLWVADDGPGIPLEEQPHLFERFHRGASGGRPTSGAGLGLAIVAAITDAHGGEVEVASEPGAGARFTLHLPADDGART